MKKTLKYQDWLFPYYLKAEISFELARLKFTEFHSYPFLRIVEFIGPRVSLMKSLMVAGRGVHAHAAHVGATRAAPPRPRRSQPFRPRSLQGPLGLRHRFDVQSFGSAVLL